MWRQGVSSQVERRLCPECGGQGNGGYGHYWCVLITRGVCSDADATAAGRRCGNPGPTGKEGIYNPVLGKMTRFRVSNLSGSKVCDRD